MLRLLKEMVLEKEVFSTETLTVLILGFYTRGKVSSRGDGWAKHSSSPQLFFFEYIHTDMQLMAIIMIMKCKGRKQGRL